MTTTIIVFLVVFVIMMAGLIGVLLMFSSASEHLDKYSFRKEIEKDLKRKGFKLLTFEKAKSMSTPWKDNFNFDGLRDKTAYRQVSISDASGNISTHFVRFRYRSALPDSVDYSPALP